MPWTRGEPAWRGRREGHTPSPTPAPCLGLCLCLPSWVGECSPPHCAPAHPAPDTRTQEGQNSPSRANTACAPCSSQTVSPLGIKCFHHALAAWEATALSQPRVPCVAQVSDGGVVMFTHTVQKLKGTNIHRMQQIVNS